MRIRKPEMFNLAEEGGNRKLGKQIFNFILVFILASIIASIPTIILSIMDTRELMNSGLSTDEINIAIETLSNSRKYMYVSLFSTILSSIVVILYCCKKQKRSLRSIGFTRKNAVRDYLIGILIGFVMFSLVVGLNILTGAMTIDMAAENFSFTTLGFILLFFIGFVFQGAEEEILTRGYLMVNVGAKHKTITALLVSAIIFAVLHGFNPGITILSLINLVLIAIFFGLYIICFDNIWGACAIHSVWNFVQGNFYGIKVSGMNMFDSIFVSTSVPGKEFINGGTFGAEGGIATTIVTVLSIVLLLIYMKKRGQIEMNAAEKN